MKATINQITNETLYRGEDKDFTVYLYDEDTHEPIDITSYDEIKICLGNEDLTTLELTATQPGAEGKFAFSVTAAESILLAVQTNFLNIQLNVTAGPTINKEVFSNYIIVKDTDC